LGLFGIFFPIWECCRKKSLATVVKIAEIGAHVELSFEQKESARFQFQMERKKKSLSLFYNFPLGQKTKSPGAQLDIRYGQGYSCHTCFR
jgi:hypothetical protein